MLEGNQREKKDRRDLRRLLESSIKDSQHLQRNTHKQRYNICQWLMKKKDKGERD